MSVRVRVPGPLRRLTGGDAEVTVDGATVSAALGDLEQRYPGFRDRLYDADGKLRQFINIYVNDFGHPLQPGPRDARRRAR